MAQELLGRVLDRNEWVTLKDRNPSNLSPENIEIVTPRVAVSRRYAT